VKLYLDEGLPPRLAGRLRARRLAAMSAEEAGNAGLDARAQLRYAAAKGRAMVTADVVGVSVLAAAAVAANETHAGIILVSAKFRTDDLGPLERGIGQVAARFAGGLDDTVVYLERPHRLRRRPRR